MFLGRKESPWSMVVQNSTWQSAPNAAPRDLDVYMNEDEPQLTWQPPKFTTGRITGTYFSLNFYNLQNHGNRFLFLMKNI